MKYRVRLFAAAQELAGAAVVEVDAHRSLTAGQLSDALAEAYPRLAPLLPHVRFAVNLAYVPSSQPLHETDDIACIPPVSGG